MLDNQMVVNITVAVICRQGPSLETHLGHGSKVSSLAADDIHRAQAEHSP